MLEVRNFLSEFHIIISLRYQMNKKLLHNVRIVTMTSAVTLPQLLLFIAEHTLLIMLAIAHYVRTAVV